jgi:hypothetical protein
MLGSQFSAIFPNFRRKMAFFSKNMLMIHLLQKLTLLQRKAPIVSPNFLAKIFLKS